jgi:predicted RecA/RadA family phage recombinase
MQTKYRGEFTNFLTYNVGDIVKRGDEFVIMSRAGVWKSLSALKPDPADMPPPAGRDGKDGKDAVSIPGRDGNGFRWLGKYKRQEYEPLDCIEVAGSSYVCVIRTKQKPPSPAWNLLCKAGEDGTTEHLYTTVNRVFNRTVPGGGGDAEPIAAIFDDTTVRGQVLYVPSDGHVGLARANAQATAGAVGFALSDTNAGQAGTYLSEGILADFAGLSAGAVYYLSADIAGAWTATAPTVGFVSILGRALSSTDFDCSPLPPVKL